MKIYRNITVSKISDHGGNAKAPTHALVASDDKYQNKVTVGKFWTKEGTYGKFLSGSMSDKYVSEKDGQTVEYPAYVIVEERELVELLTKGIKPEKEDALFEEAMERDQNIRLEDIPF